MICRCVRFFFFLFHKNNTLTVYEQDDSWDLVSHADAILLDHDYHYHLSWKKENNVHQLLIPISVKTENISILL